MRIGLLVVILSMLATVGIADSNQEDVVINVDSDLMVEEKAVETEPTEVAIDVDSDLVVEEKPLHVDSDLVVEEETLDTAPGEAGTGDETDPLFNSEIIAKVFSRLSARCLKELDENTSDPSKVSDRCRSEFARQMKRYLERLDKKEKGEDSEEKPDKKHKRRNRKSKKQKRAAAARKKEEEYQKTLKTIVGFVVTLVAVIAGAMFFINRKLKAAGMYFPDPSAKATCCN